MATQVQLSQHNPFLRQLLQKILTETPPGAHRLRGCPKRHDTANLLTALPKRLRDQGARQEDVSARICTPMATCTPNSQRKNPYVPHCLGTLRPSTQKTLILELQALTSQDGKQAGADWRLVEAAFGFSVSGSSLRS